MKGILGLTSLLIVSWTALIFMRVRFNHRLRKTQMDLTQSQERFALILRSSRIGLWYWDIGPNVITADENCSMIFGLPLGEFPQTIEGFAALVHPRDRDRVQQEIGDSVERGAPYDAEFRVLWHDGTVRYVLARGKADRGEDHNMRRLTGVCWDVTEHRKGEEDLRHANATLKQSLDQVERHTEQSLIVSEMADLLQSCSQSSEAYKIVARFCAHLFPDCAGVLYIFSASRNFLKDVVTWNDPTINDSAFDPEDCWALRRGHPHTIVPGVFATPCAHLKGIEGDRHACFPLMAQGIGLGIMYLQSRPRNDTDTAGLFPNEADLKLGVVVAERSALCLSNLALQEALRFQNIRDPLTGLFNRRYLEESMERELHRMERRNKPAGVAMIDIDHFKAFNDTYGHEAGDAVLRAFGQFLREHLRKEDVACRYGGEEFCILFCESALENIIMLAEKLRSEIKQLVVQHGGEHLSAITISIGVACYPAHANTVFELIGAADTALYQAKAAGRDRVVAAFAKTSSNGHESPLLQ
jgi:diguanylate cyclase (GGDEF)-like protein/PAS domain S-box-containing protein